MGTRQKRIFTVEGTTDNLRAHCAQYGVKYGIVYHHLFRDFWTIEQALGIDPPPPRKLPQSYHESTCLIPADEILYLVISGQIDAEEYLRLEGVKKNNHLLQTANFADDESSACDVADASGAGKPTAILVPP